MGSLSLSPVDVPDPGIELGSPASQADSLPTKLSGKPVIVENVLQLWYWSYKSVNILKPLMYTANG